jgi:hypothetical protein
MATGLATRANGQGLVAEITLDKAIAHYHQRLRW